MKNYFDLHCHPTSKSFLSDMDENKRISPWKKVRGKALQALAPIIKSQSNFTQLHEGNVKLAVFALVPIEKGFSNFWLLEDILSVFTVLDRKFIRDINYEIFSYNRLFRMEFEHLNGRLEDRDKNRYVNILKSIEDFKEDPTYINGIIAIEGGHALKENQGSDEEYRSNLLEIKNDPRFSALYLTLTHLTINNLCNHAYGAKMTKSKIMKPDLTYSGIRPLGYELIDIAYSTANGKRILIDIKHMSPLARRHFYKYRQDKNYTSIPIVATHMGVAGFALKDIKDHIDSIGVDDKGQGYKVVKYKEVLGIGDRKRNKTDFNPWSINLYDEDIQEIIASDGLIGVSLDQRILGFGKNSEEFFNPESFNELLAGAQLDALDRGEIVVEDVDPEALIMDDEYEDEDAFEESNLIGRKRKHLRYLCNNILHIIKAGGPKAWKHICIGSDYDGLINAINNCKSAADLPELEDDLVSEIQTMAKEDGGDYFIGDLREQIRGFMYDNAQRFLSKYYTKNYLNTGVVGG